MQGEAVIQAQHGSDVLDREASPAVIARLRVAEERIAALSAELATTTKARAELVHLVSHELRTPITVISGFARLLQNEGHGPLNAEQHRFVREGLKACRRLDDFVGDLLAARMDADTPFTLEPATHDLHESIEGLLESLGPMLEERGMKVEATLRAEPPIFVFDARRIEQVVTNLMTNAIRYGRNAGVIRVATDFRGDSVVVSVEDDGPGIAPADRERLFAPFVRGASVVDTVGLGIGLSICRRIIDGHGGSIHVEDATLGGARFVFELPRAASARSEK